MPKDNMFLDALSEFEKATQVMKEAKMATLTQVARLVRDEAKQSTPVISGDLRRNYYATPAVIVSGEKIRAEAYNAFEMSSYEELGHRQKKRWVPGRWQGNKFIYDPNSKGGMMLTERWVPGSFRLTTIADKYRKLIPQIYEKQFETLKRKYGVKS